MYSSSAAAAAAAGLHWTTCILWPSHLSFINTICFQTVHATNSWVCCCCFGFLFSCLFFSFALVFPIPAIKLTKWGSCSIFFLFFCCCWLALSHVGPVYSGHPICQEAHFLAVPARREQPLCLFVFPLSKLTRICSSRKLATCFSSVLQRGKSELEDRNT